MTGGAPRQPHAVLDLASRRAKALKIERLLRLDQRPGSLRLLEVGTGSGGIAHYFGTHPSGRFEVQAVDVVDNRLVTEGYGYQDVTGIELPFPDRHFDVVLSNHVIEHVGERPDQVRHLAELHRVMADDGIGYLAVPNRWMLVEPHFRLAFLSWLPLPLADGYVRMAGKGTHYDCRPLTASRAEALLDAAGFAAEQVHGEALKLTYELERPAALIYRALFRRVPDNGYRAVRRAFPTLIYTMSKRGPA